MASGSSSTATIVRDPEAGPSVAASLREESDCTSAKSGRGSSSRPSKRSSKKSGRGSGIGRWVKRLGDALLCRARSDPPVTSNERPSPTSSVPPQLSISIPPRSALSLSLSSATARHSISPKGHSPTSSRSSPRSQIDKSHAAGPISTLPPELIIEIFTFVLFSPIEPTNTARRTRTTTLTLTQICSAWRTLVLSTPVLWSWVFVRVGDPPDLEEAKGPAEGQNAGKDKGKAKESVGGSKYPKLVTALEDWISRTNPEHALTIQMYYEDEDAWKDRQPPDEVIGVLMRHKERWRSVDFTLPEACYDEMRLTVDVSPPSPDSEELEPPWTPYPLLESISLQPLLSDAQRAQSERKTLDVFKNIVPSLTHLRLNGYYLDDCHFPWSQLRSLALQHVYIDECFFALSQAPSLVDCILSTMLRNDCYRPVAREKKDITLPLLEVFRLQSATEVGSEQAMLLSHLRLPALRELAISSPDVQKAFNEVPRLTERSGCEHTLKILEVGGWDERSCRDDESEKGSEEAVVELLEGMPGLEEVHVKPEVGELGDVFLGALCRGIDERQSEAEARKEAPESPTATSSPTSSVPFPSSSSSSRVSTPTSGSGASSTKKTPLLPNLRVLDYDGDGSFEEDLLMKMVKLRCPSDRHSQASSPLEVKRLEVLKFCTRRTYSDECHAVLDEAGLGSW